MELKATAVLLGVWTRLKSIHVWDSGYSALAVCPFDTSRRVSPKCKRFGRGFGNVHSWHDLCAELLVLLLDNAFKMVS